MGVWLKPTFHATPLPLCHETSVCTLEVSALIRESLPRPWGEGGRRPGEGQPTGIAPQKCPYSRTGGGISDANRFNAFVLVAWNG